MKNFTLLIIIVLVLNSSFLSIKSEAQWIVQNSGITANLYDVEFINRNTGWALGDGGKVLKTTNGGINWLIIPNPSIIGGGILTSIFPVDSLYCYVAGGYDVILKTTNGGANWIEISNGPLLTGGYNGVYFLNRDTGWFCGSKRVLRTTNGGLSFDSAVTISFNSDIYFRNFYEGLYCTAGKVYKSTNSGMNWYDSNVPFNGRWYEFRKLSVVNNQFVSVIGNGPPFYRSTDFGTTWSVLDSIKSFPPSVMQAVAFSSVNTGWAGGSYGYLYKTTNGGYNWYRQNTGTNQAFWASIYCFNDSVVWGVGGGGKIMHTTTGGEWLTGINNLNEITVADFELFQNYPNPFNNSTKIMYKINIDGNYRFELFDIAGRKKDDLFQSYIKRGSYEYNYETNELTSGIYFLKLSSNKESKIIKIILVK